MPKTTRYPCCSADVIPLRKSPVAMEVALVLSTFMIAELVKSAATVVPAIIEYTPYIGLIPASRPLASAPGTFTIDITNPATRSFVSTSLGTLNPIKEFDLLSIF
jgi:hypothetical protein